MKITNTQLKQIIKEELEKVLEGISTPEMVRANPQDYKKESAVLLNKLLNNEIRVEELDDAQLEMMVQKIPYLSQGAFSTGDHYRAYITPEYKTMEAIEAESEKRRKAKVNLSKHTKGLDPGYDY